MARAKEIIGGMTAEAEIGKIYRGKVVTIKEFGAFVEFLPGKDGLVHISELANFRVKQTEDIVKMGDEIWVKCLGVDEKGRVKLSRRAALKRRGESETGVPMGDGGEPRGEYRGGDGGGRRDRGERRGGGGGRGRGPERRRDEPRAGGDQPPRHSRNRTPKITSLRANVSEGAVSG